MYEQIPLRSLDVMESGRVTAVQTTESMRRRFWDIGIAKGTVVRCLYSAPSGDPRAYAVHGAVIAIRDRDAGDVWVAPLMGVDP